MLYNIHIIILWGFICQLPHKFRARVLRLKAAAIRACKCNDCVRAGGEFGETI